MQTSEMFENDIDWLFDKLPNASEDEQEDFAERVAILIFESGVDENSARNFALKQIYKKRNIT